MFCRVRLRAQNGPFRIWSVSRVLPFVGRSEQGEQGNKHAIGCSLHQDREWEVTVENCRLGFGFQALTENGCFSSEMAKRLHWDIAIRPAIRPGRLTPLVARRGYAAQNLCLDLTACLAMRSARTCSSR